MPPSGSVPRSGRTPAGRTSPLPARPPCPSARRTRTVAGMAPSESSPDEVAGRTPPSASATFPSPREHPTPARRRSRRHPRIEPEVQHLMQVNVRQKRRDHPTLGRPQIRATALPFLHHSRLEPLVNHPTQHSVAHPAVEKAPKSPVIQGVEELLDVYLRHPPTLHLHQPLPQNLQRLMRRPARAKAVRAVPKVLLINGLHHHCNRPLKHLVFESRYPDRPRPAPIPFGNVDTPH